MAWEAPWEAGAVKVLKRTNINTHVSHIHAVISKSSTKVRIVSHKA